MDKMRDLAYYNGKITAIDDMMIPANDRGFYFGDGIYEAAMVLSIRSLHAGSSGPHDLTVQPCFALSFPIQKKKSARF